MKHMKRTLSLLLTLCMLLGCMTVGVMAAEPAVTTARGSAANPIPVYSNKADNSYGNVTLDVDATVSDDGVLTFYDYGTVKSNGFVYLTAESNNEKVATVEGSYEGGTLKLTFTGVADGVATVTVDYSCTTYGGSDSIYGEHSGAALGKLYYTVKVGTGRSTPVTPDQPGEGPTYDKDGYQAIHNEAELRGVAKDMTKNYFLANDITISSAWTPLGWTDGDDVAYTGNFDGNGYTITGLTSSDSGSNWGLFAINDGVIENLSVEMQGTIKGSQFVGVIAGQNNGTIRNVSVTQDSALNSGEGVQGTDNSQTFVGGITGRNNAGGMVANSFAKVAVHGQYFVGGLVGGNFGTVMQSYCKGSVNNMYNNNSLSSCAYNGGLVGGNKGLIQDCYSYTAGEVKGNQYVGGAVGGNYADGNVENVWVDPYVMALNTSKSGVFAGAQNGTVTQSYVVSTTSGTQGGATRISSDDLQDSETFPTTSQWDFETIWTYEGTKYPVLRNCGNDTSSHPRQEIGDTDTVTVTFLGGSLGGDTVTELAASYEVASGTEINLPAAPVRTNDQNWVYDFKGWSDGENTYDVGAVYTVTGDVTFTATWKLHSVNGDGEWTYLDAMTIMDYLAGNITLTAEQIEAADYNHDGTVSYLDAMRIMDVLAGNG